MNTRIKPRKKQAVEAALRKTTRTNELVYRLQSHPMPFEIAFWQLLELTRTLERELAELQDSLGTTEDETHACQI